MIENPNIDYGKPTEKVNNHLLLLFAIYSLFVFVYKDFNIPQVFGYFIVGLGLLMALLMPQASNKIRINNVDIAFLVIVLFMSIEIIIALIFTKEKTFLMYIPGLFMCLAFVVLSKPTKKELHTTVRLWTTVSVISSLYVLLIRVVPQVYYSVISHFLSRESNIMNQAFISKGYGVSLGGNVVLVDYILAFMCCYLFSSITLRKETLRNKRSEILKLILFLITILVINRKTELFCIFAVFCLGVLYKQNYRFRGRRQKTLLFAFVIFVGIVIITIELFKRGALGRYGIFISNLVLNITQNTTYDISSGRLRLWEIAIELFKGRPLLGIGWGSFAHHIPAYMRTGDVEGYVLMNVHNCYLQILCETGIVGFILFFAPIFYIFVKLLQRTKVLLKSNCMTEYVVLNNACIGYQLFFLLASFIDPCMYKLIFWCFYAISIIISDTAFRNGLISATPSRDSL